jgi:uncharacterized alpha-E superfamily protein
MAIQTEDPEVTSSVIRMITIDVIDLQNRSSIVSSLVEAALSAGVVRFI